MNFIALISLMFLIRVSIESKIIKSPYFPKLCPLSSPNYEKCAANFLRKASPFILKGMKHLKLPNLQPLVIPQINLEETAMGILFKVKAKNVTSRGFETAQLLNFRFDKSNLHATISTHLERLFIQADTNITMVNPVEYTVPQYIEVDSRDIDLVFDCGLRPVKKHGTRYFEFQWFKTISNINKAQIKLTHHNSEEQVLSTFMEDIFNANSEILLKAIKSVHNEYLTAYYKGVISRMLDILPADELIPLV